MTWKIMNEKERAPIMQEVSVLLNISQDDLQNRINKYEIIAHNNLL